MSNNDVKQAPTFTFAGFVTEHTVGDQRCTAGMCGNTNGYFAHQYPETCSCGGLIHCNASFVGFNDAYWGPELKCDRCGRG